jgi:hypothetical protein
MKGGGDYQVEGLLEAFLALFKAEKSPAHELQGLE